jgi:prepilin-type N-terminal cleavage/methylation domain-containing protein/prepilin-type processing-associated H-X9-DG protein
VARQPSPRSVQSGFTLLEVLVAVSILAIVVAIVLPAVQVAREAGRRIQCINNLKQIGLSLQNYLSAQNCFPGVDLWLKRGSNLYHSPITRALAGIDQTALFNAVNFDLSPVEAAALQQNLTAMQIGLGVCLCPSDSTPPVTGYGRVNYRFNLGPTYRWAPDQLFPGSFSGPFTVHYVYTPADFRDGLSNTIGASERLQGNWLNHSFKLGGDYLLGSFPLNSVRYADQAVSLCSSLPTTSEEESRGGESWFISGFHFTSYNHCLPPNDRRPDCALDGVGVSSSLADRVNLDGVFKASSSHAGGVNCLLMDGSVRFVKDSVNLNLWRAVATRSGGEVVSTDF